jgi:hypothetical protein
MNNATSAAFGPVTMYAANDPAVAPANKVLQGTSNLGVGGTLDITADNPIRRVGAPGAWHGRR